MTETLKGNLLITGASGFLGWNICREAAREWNVVAVVNRHRIDLPGFAVRTCDLTAGGALRRLFHDANPDAVIHAAAASQPNYCQRHPRESFAINVEASRLVAELCAERQIPLAFTSTDLVFDGQTPPYREECPVSPINLYGEQKAEAEGSILGAYPAAAVCRMPLMFGDPGPVAESFIQPWIESLRRKQPLLLFTDEHRTPVCGRTAARGILLALKRVHGIIHLGGRERVSRYEFGVMLARTLGLDESLLRRARRGDVPMPAARPPDVSLDSSRAYGLGYDPPGILEALRMMMGKHKYLS